MARRSRRVRNAASHTPFSGDSGGMFVPESSNVLGSSYGGAGQGYDAVGNSSMRGYIYWPQMDTRKEITSYTHLEIMRRARALAENVGLAGHILECMADLLGYLTPMAATHDREWNELANANFRNKQSVPEVFDAAGKFGFWEYQLQANEAAFRDGDLLPVLTSTTSGTARIATYEAHQIRNPGGSPDNVDDWVNGVQIDPFGRHRSYSIVDPNNLQRITTIPAANAIYYGHFKKLGHVRPVSVLRRAINHLQDIGEIVRDVKYGIKVRNQIPLSLESALGAQNFASGATSAIVGQVRSKSVPAQDGAGNAVAQRVDYEEIMQGGNIPRLAPGQSLKAIVDAAPHPNQLALLDWMVRDISWGCGLAPEIVWNINTLRGANNRLLNSKLQRWIGARLLRQKNFVRRYWVYAIAKELKANRLPTCRDPEWWKVAMLPQASITADRGREGKLDIDLVANRLMSLQQFFAKDGQDWLTEIRQMSAENDPLKELGLVVADVARGMVQLPTLPEPVDALDDEDPAAIDEPV